MRVRRPGRVPQALGPGIGFHQGDLRLAAPGQAQVVQRLDINREDAAGGAVLRGHVGDGGAVGQRQVLQAIAVELDELADHAQPAQHLGDGQHQIGGGGALGQAAAELEADHLRDQHRGGLAEHGRLGLDAAHAPAEHADAVDHGGVRVGAEHGVREGPAGAVDLALHHHPGQVLQVHLVHDAGIGWHHLEVLERLLAPAQEAVALAVALELDAAVEVQRVGAAEHVHLHRVVDHQFRGDQRIDLLGAPTQPGDRVAHRRQVHHAGHAGEILQHHPCRHEGDLGVRFGLRVPGGHGLDVLWADRLPPILVAEQVLQQDLHRVGQVRDVEALAQPGQAAVRVGLVADGELAAGGERIAHG